MAYQAEYIWIDGTEPTPLLRSQDQDHPGRRRAGHLGLRRLEHQPGRRASASDCVLQPVFICPDPIRGGDDILVLCEVLLIDMTPHPTNTRAACAAVAEKYADQEPCSASSRSTRSSRTAARSGWPQGGYPGPQGPYYCGVGADEIWGRDIVEAHTEACIDAGLAISGTNAEVMMGQWEFQIGPAGPADSSATSCGSPAGCSTGSAEDFDVAATLDPKPMPGDWNGAGAHTNFSTKAMRESYDADHHGVRGARREGRGAHHQLRPRRRAAPHRSPRDRPVDRVQLRRLRTAAPRCASRGRSRRTRRATSRIVAPTPTWIPTS